VNTLWIYEIQVAKEPKELYGVTSWNFIF